MKAVTLAARATLPLCALAASLAMSSAAQAKPNTVVRPKGLHLVARLPATNGYAASIRTSGHRQVALSFAQGSYQLTYKTLGRVTRRGISADFGRFGHVSFRFRSKGRVKPDDPFSIFSHCKGRKGVVERGVFVGNVRFTGERRFTQVRAHRLKGTTVRTYRRVCQAPGYLTAAASRTDYEGNVLSALAGKNGVRRTFIALESSIDVEDEFFGFGAQIAALQEKVDGVAISKAVITLGEGIFRRLQVDGPAEVRVVPEWPLYGTATFMGGNSPTWSGSLGVRLPGSGQVSLAGPEFEVKLCRTASPRGLSGCVESVLTRQLLYRRALGR